MSAPLTESLRRSPPSLHDSPDYWGLAWDALAWVEAVSYTHLTLPTTPYV